MSVWEQDQKAVKPFVDADGRPDGLPRRHRCDPREWDANDGAMARNWMTAAGQGGIPTAFIINKDGRIAWIGHPMQMDGPLEKIVKGSWDLAAASAEFRKGIEDREGRGDWRKLQPAGNNLRTTGQGLEEDVAGLRDAIRLRPDDGGLYSNYGRLLGYLGRHDEAIEACRKAIELNPNDGGAHYNLGNSLAAKGQLRDALAAFREAQRVEPVAEPISTLAASLPCCLRRGRAAAGKGKDEPPPDDAAKVKLRQQALDWLRAELASLGPSSSNPAPPQARPAIVQALGTGSRTRTSPASATTRLWPGSRRPSGRNGRRSGPMWIRS